jgi:deoxycytidylate deaminase
MPKRSDMRVILKYITYMKITERISSLSYDPKHKVGSIILKKDFSNIIAIGYNGNYEGGSNERDSDVSGMSGFIHAEENVLIKANITNPVDYMLMVTLSPCEMCAKRIVNSRIKDVLYLENYQNGGKAFHVFETAKVRHDNFFDFIGKLYSESSLFPELVETVRVRFRQNGYTPGDRAMLLTELAYIQMEKFFDGRDNPLWSAPLKPMDITDMDDDAVIVYYIQNFCETLYRVL